MCRHVSDSTFYMVARTHLPLSDVYYLGFPKDRLIPKAIVGVVFILELLQTVLATKDGFDYFGAGWGNMLALDQVGLFWMSVPVLTGIRAWYFRFSFLPRTYASY